MHEMQVGHVYLRVVKETLAHATWEGHYLKFLQQQKGTLLALNHAAPVVLRMKESSLNHSKLGIKRSTLLVAQVAQLFQTTSKGKDVGTQRALTGSIPRN